MVVTDQRAKHWRRRRFLITYLVGCSALILSFQNCAVDLNSSTPGAAKLSAYQCSLTPQEATDMTNVLTTILQSTGTTPSGDGLTYCGACHLPGGVGNGAFSVFPGTSAASVQENACNILALGPIVLSHPQSGSHTGGQFSAADIQAFITWFNTYYQP